jgi:hypothetical protein
MTMRSTTLRSGKRPEGQGQDLVAATCWDLGEAEALVLDRLSVALRRSADTPDNAERKCSNLASALRSDTRRLFRASRRIRCDSP